MKLSIGKDDPEQPVQLYLEESDGEVRVMSRKNSVELIEAVFSPNGTAYIVGNGNFKRKANNHDGIRR